MWKYIYLTIDSHPYWLYKWENWKYILQDHRDGKKPLILEKWKKYVLVLKDFLSNTNIDYKKEIAEVSDPNQIKELFKKYVKIDALSERSKKEVSNYVKEIIKREKLIVNDRFITYIDNRYNRLFLFYSDNWKLKLLWYDKVSTWNPKRWKKYHKTPYLIVDREKSKLYQEDWYAEWTDRKWYGPKWSRIYFLWKYFVSQDGKISLSYKKWYKEIHLAFHTTTPWWLTQLWKPMSMGCIRTSRFINVLYNKNSKINEWIFIIWDVKNHIMPTYVDNLRK